MEHDYYSMAQHLHPFVGHWQDVECMGTQMNRKSVNCTTTLDLPSEAWIDMHALNPILHGTCFPMHINTKSQFTCNIVARWCVLDGEQDELFAHDPAHLFVTVLLCCVAGECMEFNLIS